ncbi:MAG: hypothetical protein C5B55_04770 [Blastocatellia bacterium]|nr:MAG: hypothetical protein C5B55_04770 [Blastocatellia bacterium]
MHVHLLRIPRRLHMRSPTNTGRVIGILILLHLIVGLTTPYIILRPLGASFDASALVNGAQVRLAVMLLFLGGALTIAIALNGWSTFREYSFTFATWLIALAIANFALQCVENATWMSLFTFSREYAKANAGEVSLFHVTGIGLRMIWKWVHYTHLLIMVSWMFLLGVMLWRSTVVPQTLAVLLPLGSLLQIFGITLPQFIPYPTPPMTLMGLPLGIVYLALAVWLIVRGFSNERKSFAT